VADSQYIHIISLRQQALTEEREHTHRDRHSREHTDSRDHRESQREPQREPEREPDSQREPERARERGTMMNVMPPLSTSFFDVSSFDRCIIGFSRLQYSEQSRKHYEDY
jgi:hypothetical protein